MSTKRYYWIKLRTDFFELPTIDWLLEQENGCKYVVLYQKLCLLAANTGGELVRKIGQMMIPYDVKKIAELTKFDFDTVVIGISLYKKCGLIVEENSDGTLKISNFDDVVGSESKWAKYKRKERETLAEEDLPALENVQTSSKEIPRPQKSMNFLPESLENVQTMSNENTIRDRVIEIDKDKEIIDKEIEGFNEFWNSYPKKSKKFMEETKIIFSYLIKHGISSSDMIKAAQRYYREVIGLGTESKFIKMPNNFLSDGKYLEYVPAIQSDCPICKGEGYILNFRDNGSAETFLCSCRDRFKKFKNK